MSRNPGLGSKWFEKYQSDIYPWGRMIIRGQKMSVPRHYAEMHKKMNPLEGEIQRNRRIYYAEQKMWENMEKGEPKLSVKNIVKKAVIKSLTRDLE